MPPGTYSWDILLGSTHASWDMILPLHHVTVTLSVDFHASKNLHVDYL